MSKAEIRRAFEANVGEYKLIPANKIVFPDELNARHRINQKELEELGESIATVGLKEPIGVTNGYGPDGDMYLGEYGTRRYLAITTVLGLKDVEIPCVVHAPKTQGSGKSRVLANFTENEQRVQVCDYDRAKRLLEMFEGTYPVPDGETPDAFSYEELQAITGKSRSYLQNLVSCHKLLCKRVLQVWQKQDVPLRRLFSWKHLSEEDQVRALETYLGEKDQVESPDVVDEEAEAKPKKRRKEVEAKPWIVEPKRHKPGVAYATQYVAVLLAKAEGTSSKVERARLEGAAEALRFALGDLKRMPGVNKADLDALAKAEARAAEEAEASEEDDGDGEE